MPRLPARRRSTLHSMRPGASTLSNRTDSEEMTMAKTFGAESTTDEVLDGVDLRGKRILVTGASAGLGIETARALVAHGAHVVGAARDLGKAQRATESVRSAAKNGAGFELVALDLAS